MAPSAMEGPRGMACAPSGCGCGVGSSGDERPFAAMNADPQVMEHFPTHAHSAASLEMMRRMNSAIERDGYGFWAVELIESGELAGFVGLQDVTDPPSPFAPAIEVGWRLDRRFWGRGIATEAGAASVGFAFSSSARMRFSPTPRPATSAHGGDAASRDAPRPGR